MLSSIPAIAGCVRLGLVTLVNRLWYNMLVGWALSPGNEFFKILSEGCAMNTFILNAETSSLTIDHLLKQAEAGGLEVRDAQGKVLAIVLSPDDQREFCDASSRWPAGYFEKTAGALAGEDFLRPSQGELPRRDDW